MDSGLPTLCVDDCINLALAVGSGGAPAVGESMDLDLPDLHFIDCNALPDISLSDALPCLAAIGGILGPSSSVVDNLPVIDTASELPWFDANELPCLEPPEP